MYNICLCVCFVYIHMCVFIHMSVCVSVCVCMCVCVCVCVCLCVCVCVLYITNISKYTHSKYKNTIMIVSSSMTSLISYSLQILQDCFKRMPYQCLYYISYR